MTKKEMYVVIANVLKGSYEGEVATTEMIEFINKEIDRMNRPKSTAPTKNQIENEKLMDKILEIMREIGEPMTVSMIQKEINEIENAEYSNQKINSLMIKLQKAHEVEKFTKDKKTYFLEIVPEEEE